jgi:hypothetical protein
MATARAPGWYWIEQDALESAIIPKGPWVAYWTDAGAGYWTLAYLGATWPDDDETIRVLAGPLPPPNETPERDPRASLDRPARMRSAIVYWLRVLANAVNDGKWMERVREERASVGKDLRAAANELDAEHQARGWLSKLATQAENRMHLVEPPTTVATNLRIVASAIENGTLGADRPTLEELVTVLCEAGFRVAKNLAHPFLGPTPEDRWTMWCCECGRDSGFHHDHCSKRAR